LSQATVSLVAASLAACPKNEEGARPAIDNALLRRARKFVEQNLCDEALSATLLCAQLRVSRSTLYRLFEPLGGVAQYIKERRLARVHELLARAGDRPQIARLAEAHGAFDRFIIATDTPTGSGIMPLGMLYTIAHLSSLTDMTPERFICAASGSNARVYGLDSGVIAPGKAADIVLIDAPDGGTQQSALAAIKHGDIAAIGAVVTAGVPRFVGRSRNTPATTRKARVAVSRVMQDFAAPAH